MASWTGSSTLHSGSYKLTLSVTETKVDNANNTSTLTWSLAMYNNSYYYYRGFNTSVTVQINGVNVAPSSSVDVYMDPSYSAQYHSYTFWSGKTTVVAHERDGTKTVRCYAKISRPETYDGNGNWTNYLPGDIVADGYLTLTNIPRTSTLTIPDMTIGTSDTTYTIGVNKEEPTHKDTITYSVLGHTGTCLTASTATSFNFTVPASWLNDISNATSTTGTFSVTTDKGSEGTLSETFSFTLNVNSSIVPTTPTVTASRVPSTTSQYGTNISKVALAFSSTPVGGTGVTISKFIISGSASAEVTAVSGAGTYTTNVFTTAGVKTFNVVAQDSRGRRSAAGSTSVTYVAYNNPVITSVTIERGYVENNTFVPLISGSALRVTVTATVSLIDNNGNFTILVRESGTSSGGYSGTISGLSGSLVFDQTSDQLGYSVIVTFTDLYGGTTTRTETAPKINVPLNINPDSTDPGLAFGGMATRSHAVELYSPWKLYLPGITNDIASTIIPKAGSRVQIWSGSYGSGDWSNFSSYSSYLFYGTVSDTDVLCMIEVPRALFSSYEGGRSVQLSDEAAYFALNLWYTGNTGHFSRRSATNSSYALIKYVYGIY